MGHKEVNSLAVDQLVSYQLCLTAKPLHYATLPANHGLLRTGRTVRLIRFCTRDSDLATYVTLSQLLNLPGPQAHLRLGVMECSMMVVT